MIEELLEVAGSRWGLLGLGAALLFAGPGRKVVRGAAKGAIKAGLSVSDAAREFVAEVKEQGGDLIAEVQAERKENADNHQSPAHKEKKSKKSASAE